jgi:hypothetical protein
MDLPTPCTIQTKAKLNSTDHHNGILLYGTCRQRVVLLNRAVPGPEAPSGNVVLVVIGQQHTRLVKGVGGSGGTSRLDQGLQQNGANLRIRWFWPWRSPGFETFRFHLKVIISARGLLAGGGND